MDAMFPYDVTKMGVVGRTRWLYAPLTVAIPTNIDDVIAMVSPYAAKTGWKEWGAGKSARSYSRDVSGSEIGIEEETSSLFETIDEVNRQFTLSIVEFDEDKIKILEEAPAIGTIAAAAGKSAQKSVLFGGFTAFTSYRLVQIGMRHIDSGIVTEPTGGRTRGRLVMGMAYRARLTTDAISMDTEKGNLAELKPTFRAHAEPGQPSGQDYGGWLLESTGTIA